MKLLPSNNQIQDWLLIIDDRISTLDKRWWLALLAVFISTIPVYFLLRLVFFQSFFDDYQGPAIIYQQAVVEPLVIIDRKIFDLGANNYSGFVKIKNINLNHGVPEQDFTAEFKTAGGSTVTKVTGRTFILPSSEKFLVFARFTSETKPELLDFSLATSKFRHKPDLPALSLEIERLQIDDRGNEFKVSAAVHNLSAFTIKQIHLPAALYDADNRIVGVNLTNINQVRSGETRTFQFVWPSRVPNVVRAEITPEINIFEPSIIRVETERVLEPFDVGESPAAPGGQ